MKRTTIWADILGPQFGTPIWEDPDFGRTPIWEDPDLGGPRFGRTPIWDHKFGTPIWDLILGGDMGPRFGTPI
jgi:hypothetical protein